MSSVLERILEGNSLHTEVYFNDCIDLTKSIVLVNHPESKLYKDLLATKYGIDEGNVKTNWRYYKHLSGQYHQVDRMMQVRSYDDGTIIDLTRRTLEQHTNTRNELLKFDEVYREVVKEYPEQELLLRVLISSVPLVRVEDVVKAETNTILYYNQAKVEGHESDLIHRLQRRLTNYTLTKAIPYYALEDSLYMASMFSIMYQFLLTSILTIRLDNAKTERAHSYHYTSYLSSVHRLDAELPYLNLEQKLFLYRNAKYLNRHAGTNKVLTTLIDKFFTIRRASVLNYVYKQFNTVDEEGNIQYRYKQKLLNSANLVHDTSDYSLPQLAHKEIKTLPSNEKEHRLRENNIERKNRSSLFSELLTKDIEIVVTDVPDEVKYTKLEAYIDYWARTLELGMNSFIINLSIGADENSIGISSADLFKLFTVTLYGAAGEDLNQIPNYLCARVLKRNLPTLEELVDCNYLNSVYLENKISDYRIYAPRYHETPTTTMFTKFVEHVYKFNLHAWLDYTSEGDKDVNLQLVNALDSMHELVVYRQDDETVDQLYDRLGLNSLHDYTPSMHNELANTIIKEVSQGTLGKPSDSELASRALVNVLKKFKSYSVQLIADINDYGGIIVGLGSPYIAHYNNSDELIRVPNRVDITATKKSKEVAHVSIDDSLRDHTNSTKHHIEIDLLSDVQDLSIGTIHVPMDLFRTTIEVESTMTPEFTRSNDDLLFLSLNPL